MQKGWLNRTLGGRVIEHVPCPNPGSPVDEGAPAVGVLHTIEGSLSSGMGVFHQHFAPHFTLDAHQTLQLVPLGTMAAALENHVGGVETNAIARVQIEVAGSSKTTPWLWDEATTTAVADLVATVSKAAQIPLERPFADQMPALPWAIESFSRRHAGTWGHVAGWYGHVEVPENSHWDPGALRWSVLLDEARTFGGGLVVELGEVNPAVAPASLPAWYWIWVQWRLGEGHFKGLGPANPARRPSEVPATIPHWACVKLAGFLAGRTHAA
jgi:hypothetical protein